MTKKRKSLATITANKRAKLTDNSYANINQSLIMAPVHQLSLHDLIYEYTQDPSPKNYLQLLQAISANGENLAEQYDSNGLTPLHVAAAFKAKFLIKIMLGCGVSIDSLDEKGNTCLHQVIKAGELNFATKLLKLGASVQYKDKDENTPLHLLASSKGETASLAKQLLMSGADVDAKNSQLNTALHEAVISNNVQMVKVLLNWKANVLTVNKADLTPLQLALKLADDRIDKNDHEIVHLLFERQRQIYQISVPASDNFAETTTTLHSSLSTLAPGL